MATPDDDGRYEVAVLGVGARRSRRPAPSRRGRASLCRHRARRAARLEPPTTVCSPATTTPAASPAGSTSSANGRSWPAAPSTTTPASKRHRGSPSTIPSGSMIAEVDPAGWMRPSPSPTTSVWTSSSYAPGRPFGDDRIHLPRRRPCFASRLPGIHRSAADAGGPVGHRDGSTARAWWASRPTGIEAVPAGGWTCALRKGRRSRPSSW